jgi:hypothetical protein
VRHRRSPLLGSSALLGPCALLLAACAAAGTTPAAPATTGPIGPLAPASAAPSTSPPVATVAVPSAAPAPGRAAVTVDARVTGGTVTPRPGRVAVRQGQRVRIRVTSDRADVVHVHGYGEELRLSPGTPASLEFVAHRTGLFDVETHESGGKLLFQLVVR